MSGQLPNLPAGVKPDTMLLMANIHTTNETVSMRTEMHDLDEVLATLQRFLIASGYKFEGDLIIA